MTAQHEERCDGPSACWCAKMQATTPSILPWTTGRLFANTFSSQERRSDRRNGVVVGVKTMKVRPIANPMTFVSIAVTFALLATVPNRALGETQSKSPSITNKLHLPHIPNPLNALSSGAKKVTSTVGSLLPGKKQETTVSRYYPPQGSKKAPEKKGLFDWMKPKSQPKKSETVCDWIGKEPLLP